VQPYATITKRADLISAIHASIFDVTDAGGMVLATAATAESCADVTHAKTMSLTIVTLMRYCPMMMAT
jgi:hypothetical protein